MMCDLGQLKCLGGQRGQRLGGQRRGVLERPGDAAAHRGLDRQEPGPRGHGHGLVQTDDRTAATAAATAAAAAGAGAVPATKYLLNCVAI